MMLPPFGAFVFATGITHSCQRKESFAPTMEKPCMCVCEQLRDEEGRRGGGACNQKLSMPRPGPHQSSSMSD